MAKKKTAESQTENLQAAEPQVREDDLQEAKSAEVAQATNEKPNKKAEAPAQATDEKSNEIADASMQVTDEKTDASTQVTDEKTGGTVVTAAEVLKAAQREYAAAAAQSAAAQKALDKATAAVARAQEKLDKATDETRAQAQEALQTAQEAVPAAEETLAACKRVQLEKAQDATGIAARIADEKKTLQAEAEAAHEKVLSETEQVKREAEETAASKIAAQQLSEGEKPSKEQLAVRAQAIKAATDEKNAVIKACDGRIKASQKALNTATAEARAANETAQLHAERAESLTFEPDPKYLLQVRHLRKYFPIKKDFFGRPLANLKAVDDVSFDLERGKTLGIVGESGCGKTTMGRTILKLYQPTGGDVYFDGINVAPLSSAKVRPLRTRMQIIFQDPYSSLPPRMPVGSIIGEAVKVHGIVPKSELHGYVLDIMDKCGLRDYYFERYPHEFSGGQRQRICIARALAVNPQLIVCDEPVSALDVSIQAQIINLLKDLQQSMGLTYLFISHDLSVVKHISDNVGVMYLGSMVEFGSNKSIFANPMHPYTRALFSAVPVPDPKVKMNRILLAGDIPSPANPPTGCKFHTRCPACMDVCKKKAPVYREYEQGHYVACHLWPQE